MRHIYAQKEGRSNIKYISVNLVNAVVISFKYQIDKKHGNGRGVGGRWSSLALIMQTWSRRWNWIRLFCKH